MADAEDLIAEIEEGADPDGLPPLEKKYQKQMRQIVTQKIDLPVSTLPQMLREQIKLNPEFQRRDRWSEERQARLIESLIMNVPMPRVCAPKWLWKSPVSTPRHNAPEFL